MHQAADMSLWTGRDDTVDEGPLALRWHQRVMPWKLHAVPGHALLGFASDEGVRRNHGRIGAAKGPVAMRKALANLAWHMRDDVLDAGDVVCQGNALEAAQTLFGAHVKTLLAAGHMPLTIGGGHEIAFGTWQGLAHWASAQDAIPRVGIVNIDAHFDLRRNALASSGTPFAQIADDCMLRGWPLRYLAVGISPLANTAALFATARELGARWVTDDRLTHEGLDLLDVELGNFLAFTDAIYLTICLDAFPASVAPGVSAPAARGVDVAVAERVIDRLRDSGKLRIAEVAELNPDLDQDHRTAKLAARLLVRAAGGMQVG